MDPMEIQANRAANEDNPWQRDVLTRNYPRIAGKLHPMDALNLARSSHGLWNNTSAGERDLIRNRLADNDGWRSADRVASEFLQLTDNTTFPYQLKDKQPSSARYITQGPDGTEASFKVTIFTEKYPVLDRRDLKSIFSSKKGYFFYYPPLISIDISDRKVRMGTMGTDPIYEWKDETRCSVFISEGRIYLAYPGVYDPEDPEETSPFLRRPEFQKVTAVLLALGLVRQMMFDDGGTLVPGRALLPADIRDVPVFAFEPPSRSRTMEALANNQPLSQVLPSFGRPMGSLYEADGTSLMAKQRKVRRAAAIFRKKVAGKRK